MRPPEKDQGPRESEGRDQTAATTITLEDISLRLGGLEHRLERLEKSVSTKKAKKPTSRVDADGNVWLQGSGWIRRSAAA